LAKYRGFRPAKWLRLQAADSREGATKTALPRPVQAVSRYARRPV